MKKSAFFVVSSLLLLGACGSKSEPEQSDKVDISDIVNATCTDLFSATTDSEASATLLTGAALAEKIGVTGETFGNYLQSSCSDAISYASNLP